MARRLRFYVKVTKWFQIYWKGGRGVQIYVEMVQLSAKVGTGYRSKKRRWKKSTYFPCSDDDTIGLSVIFQKNVTHVCQVEQGPLGMCNEMDVSEVLSHVCMSVACLLIGASCHITHICMSVRCNLSHVCLSGAVQCTCHMFVMCNEMDVRQKFCRMSVCLSHVVTFHIFVC